MYLKIFTMYFVSIKETVNWPTSVLRQTMWFIGELSITEINCPQKIVALLALGWHNFTLY